MYSKLNRPAKNRHRLPAFLPGIALIVILFFPVQSPGKIYIDINSPSIRKFNVAIPDFKNLGPQNGDMQFSTRLPAVISNDLDLSGYFNPMDKEAFLEGEDAGLTAEAIRFKEWTVIGAELLVKGGYTRIGSRLEVEMRLFDPFWGRQILGKRVLGDTEQYRALMHRVSNEIIRALTGSDGIFLTKLAFVGSARDHREIYTSDFDGHNVRQITSDKSIAMLPRWSKDGKSIAYNSFKEGRGPKLYLKNLSTGSERRVSGREGLNIGAAWAPDGKDLALTLSPDGNQDIYIIDMKGKILKRLTSHWAIDVSPTFSPDGRKIAFVSNRSGSPQIYILDLRSGREDRLTFEGKYNTSPSWSSLNRISYVSMNERTQFDILTIDADGGQPIQLTSSQGSNEDPCWSPDGRYIVFSSTREGRYHLYIMNANGQNQKRITFMDGDQTSPSWSR